MVMGFEADNLRARRWQMVLLVVAGILIGGMIASFWLPSATPDAEQDALPTIEIGRVDSMPAEESWLAGGERQIRAHASRLDTLEARLTAADKRNEDLIEANSLLRERLATQAREAKAVIDTQADVIAGHLSDTGQRDPFAGLPSDAATSASNIASDIDAGDPFTPVGQSGAGVPTAALDPLSTPPSSLIRFELTPRNDASATNDPAPNREIIRDTAYYLPAGAHAKAVITAGAAASVSVTGQADPRPVLLRITGKARSAADGRGAVLDADIRGCTVVGEARGDLSSERVYVRLQTMTCRRGSGVVETPVQGFVAGTGQAGVRGQVITREGDLVEKSAMAGVLSGFGSAAAQGLRPPTLLSDAGDQPSDASVLANAGKAGVAQGIGNAGDRLAQYYINRAEQYQPVVSLKGGTTVEVIFIAGTYLDGRGLDDRNADETLTLGAIR